MYINENKKQTSKNRLGKNNSVNLPSSKYNGHSNRRRTNRETDSNMKIYNTVIICGM